MNNLICIEIKGVRFPIFISIPYKKNTLFVGPFIDFDDEIQKINAIEDKIKYNTKQISKIVEQELNCFRV